MAETILVIDDNSNLRNDLKKCALEAAPGCKVFEAKSKREALDFISQLVFSVIVTDLNLSETEDEAGFDILRVAKQRCSETQVIILTSFPKPEHTNIVKELDAFDFVNRNDQQVEFLTLLSIKIPEALAFYKLKKRQRQKMNIIFTLPSRGKHPGVRVTGGANSISSKIFELDTDLVKEISATIGTLVKLEPSDRDVEIFKQRNALSKFLGSHLWHEIFTIHPVLLKRLWESQGEIHSNEAISLCFEGEREYLDIPLELVYDGDSYLGQEHPITRSTLNVKARRDNNFSRLLETLENEQQPLRFLFIAANTFSPTLGLPPIPGTDKEIEGIYQSVKDRFYVINEEITENEVKLKCRFKLGQEDTLIGPIIEADVLYSHSSNLSTIKEKLKTGYHIVHIASHGNYDPLDPQSSNLYFWKEPCKTEQWAHLLKHVKYINWQNRDSDANEEIFQEQVTPLRGQLGELSTTELSNFLKRTNETFLVYLSCCYSARTGRRGHLVYGKSLGFLDALAKSGVPVIVGHRWPLKDEESIAFAAEFYSHLLHNYSPENSILQARKKMSQHDPTWASAVMVVQGG